MVLLLVVPYRQRARRKRHLPNVKPWAEDVLDWTIDLRKRKHRPFEPLNLLGVVVTCCLRKCAHPSSNSFSSHAWHTRRSWHTKEKFVQNPRIPASTSQAFHGMRSILSCASGVLS